MDMGTSLIGAEIERTALRAFPRWVTGRIDSELMEAAAIFWAWGYVSGCLTITGTLNAWITSYGTSRMFPCLGKVSCGDPLYTGRTRKSQSFVAPVTHVGGD